MGGAGLPARDGRNDHDAAAAPAAHIRRHALNNRDCVKEIQLEGAPPILQGELDTSFANDTPDIRNQQIYTSELRCTVVNEALDFRRLRDIGLHPVYLCPATAQIPQGALEVGRASPANTHTAFFIDQTLCDSASNAPGPAGHECDFVLQHKVHTHISPLGTSSQRHYHLTTV